MHPISQQQRRLAARGFTLIEILVALAALAIMMAIGVPAMTSWVQASKARSAADFYMEGFALARQQALSHNSSSRIVLTPNASNGQNDWQVDICFPTATLACTDSMGNWSTAAAQASGDQEVGGYISVKRLATALPKSAVLAPTMLPAGTSAIYFNSQGWVDTRIGQRMTSLNFAPGIGYEGQLRQSAIVVGLAGTAIKCDPSVAIPDSRACPP